MSKQTKAKAKKQLIEPAIIEASKLPPRPGRTYSANMDNVIFEAKFVDGSEKDDKGKYNPPHLREVISNVVSSVGSLVSSNANFKHIKKGVKIVPVSIGKITILEMDEIGFVGSIKPHDIVAVVK